jgi:hypothetical protein
MKPASGGTSLNGPTGFGSRRTVSFVVPVSTGSKSHPVGFAARHALYVDSPISFQGRDSHRRRSFTVVSANNA